MDSKLQENMDSKTEFRKPSSDSSNRKYRRRSSVSGSSSSSDGALEQAYVMDSDIDAAKIAAMKAAELDSHSSLRPKIESDKVGLSPNATAYDPSHASTKVMEKASSFNVLSESSIPAKTQGTATSLVRPSSSASYTSARGGATSTSAGRGMSPSSSVGSLSSEKLTHCILQ